MTIIKFIAFVSIGSIVLAVIIANLQTEPITYVQPERIEVACDLNCEVDKRTAIIFERNRDMYMEQSRLEAIRELNVVLMDMVYVSPYVDEDELKAKYE